MTKLSELHLAIADILTDCAKNKTTICYSDLCDTLHYPGLRTIGQELEKVSLLTYDMYGVFLSVLVVIKETQETDTPMPGTGFFDMYFRKCSQQEQDWEAVAKQQREKAYAQDWSELSDHIRSIIRKQ